MTLPRRRATEGWVASASASLSALFAGSGLAVQTTGDVDADPWTSRRCSARFHEVRLIPTTAATIRDAALDAKSLEAMAQWLLVFRDGSAVAEPAVFMQPYVYRIQ